MALCQVEPVAISPAVQPTCSPSSLSEARAGDSAVDVEGDAVDHRGVVGYEVEHRLGDVVPEQTLVVYTVQPGSPTARLLPILASWDADATVAR
jgi:hypothetical protein